MKKVYVEASNDDFYLWVSNNYQKYLIISYTILYRIYKCEQLIKKLGNGYITASCSQK